jgi:hypothetical protein
MHRKGLPSFGNVILAGRFIAPLQQKKRIHTLLLVPDTNLVQRNILSNVSNIL